MLDETDRKLLALLKENAQAKYAELGERIHLSAPAVFDRVKRLKRSGVLRRYTVEVTPAALGFSICAYVSVSLEKLPAEEVVPRLEAFDEIEECHSVTGSASLLLKARCTDPKALESLLSRLWRVPGIAGTETMLVLDTYIERGGRVT